MRRIFVLFLLFLSMGVLRTHANPVNQDHIEISVLTCSPGTEVYSLYGHTALRCNNISLGQDVVFNFGVFDFNTPNFGWRFALGQTDYMVVGIPYKEFCREYYQRGSSVTGQLLNLNSDEANNIFRALIDNCRPENRIYRYNYLTNNCTTRVRDYIEKHVDGEVVWPRQDNLKTYRQMMHEYTTGSLWAQEGNDILLGCNVDTLLNDREALFLPDYLEQAISQAEIRTQNADTRRLLNKSEVLVRKQVQLDHPAFMLSPLQCGVILFVVLMAVMTVEFFVRRQFWIVDIILMLAQGVAGAILLFLFLFSEHPTLDSNWQIWLYNPLPLLAIPIVVKKAMARKRCWWHLFNAVMLVLFIVFMPWIPQTFCQSSFPVALALLTRPLSYHLYYNRTSKIFKLFDR